MDPLSNLNQQLLIRHLGLQPYTPVWHAMQRHTQQRDSHTRDEFWVLEHQPVFTQGQAGKAEHLLATGDIPVVQVERGGQVTYHGPGQLVVYVLLDIRRRKLGARDLVTALEDSIIGTLTEYTVSAQTQPNAPGVYVAERKIASLGLRIRRGCSFHGLALNVAMDLTPFQRINPCGYAGMEMAQLNDFVPNPDMAELSSKLTSQLQHKLGYTDITFTNQCDLLNHG